MKKPNRLAIAQKVCRPLPPLIAQTVRTWLYPYVKGQADNCELQVRSQTGSPLRCSTRDFHGYPFSIHGYYEWRNTAIALALASEGHTIIEIGANVGTETVGFSDIVGETGKVHAFEPLPSNTRILSDLARQTAHRNIVVHSLALSDNNQPVKFQVPFEHSSGTGFITRTKNAPESDTVDVNCSTLDGMTAGIGRASIIFMDTEGEELRILRGAASYIREFRPAIVLEASPELLHRAGFSIDDLFHEVKAQGYFPYKIVQLGLEPVVSPDANHASNWLCVTSDQRQRVGRIRRRIIACGLMPCFRGLNPMSR